MRPYFAGPITGSGSDFRGYFTQPGGNFERAIVITLGSQTDSLRAGESVSVVFRTTQVPVAYGRHEMRFDDPDGWMWVGDGYAPGRPLPLVSVDVQTHASENGVQNGQLIFRRTGDTTDQLVVAYGVDDMLTTATLNADYEPLPGCVVFESGFDYVTVPLVPKADAIPENPDEHVMVEVLPDPSSIPSYLPKYDPPETSSTSDVPNNYRAKMIIAERPPPTVELSLATDKIPVNANNDNGSPWLRHGIPSKRDFSAENLPVADGQLVKVTATVRGGFAGTLSVASESDGSGRVAFWKNAKKTEGQFSSVAVPAGVEPFTFEFYVEGQHESSDDDDFSKIILTFTPAVPGAAVTDAENVLITPAIVELKAVVPSPSVSFKTQESDKNGPRNGSLGVGAFKPPQFAGDEYTPGISFEAMVVNGGLDIQYLQNLTDTINHPNGTAAAFVFKDGRPNANLLIKPDVTATFPFLDYRKGDAGPFYPSKTYSWNNGVHVNTDDSPGFSFSVPTNCVLDSVDYKDRFTMYLTVHYADSSIYTIAILKWNVNFYAHTGDGVNGVRVIDPESRVSIEQGWGRSNVDPTTTSGIRAAEATGARLV